MREGGRGGKSGLRALGFEFISSDDVRLSGENSAPMNR